MTYSEYLAAIFPGMKVQKISVNTGLGCPNRDGTLGRCGCIYCDNSSFTPGYCMSSAPVAAQLEEGKRFFARKYPEMKYLAYFQSYTNTYSGKVTELEDLYRDAISTPDIVGIVIGTRPDTLPDTVLDMLASLASETQVFIEIGAETSCDDTLRLINRGHTWSQVVDAVNRVASRHLHCGLHLIAGLPGEGEERILENVRKACALPIETLKLHQLQIIRDTPLHRMWMDGSINVSPLSLEDYIALCRRIIDIVPPNIVIERFLSQAPPDMVVAPKWGLKNYQFMNLLNSGGKKNK